MNVCYSMLFKEFNPHEYREDLINIFKELFRDKPENWRDLKKILLKFPRDGNGFYSKVQLVKGFYYLKNEALIDGNISIPLIIKTKPTRTISGVATISVLTKPYPCPGKCIYCPNDILMPKSYIRSEPGCRRALNNKFSPYFQVWSRLTALNLTGHVTDKVELLILGGTWNSYPENYQMWFICECFKALNVF